MRRPKVNACQYGLHLVDVSHTGRLAFSWFCVYIASLLRFGRHGDAEAFTDGRNIRLLDGPKLFAMIKQARQSMTATDQQSAGKPPMAQQAGVIERVCPHGGAEMVKRTARKGENTGTGFLGCSKFPTCRGVRQLA